MSLSCSWCCRRARPFLAVELAVFGFYLGSSFAPNHIGMPLVSPRLKLDFLRRQVLMSRNVSGGRFMSILMGGLNYQIEHHPVPLDGTPSSARCNLSSPPTARRKVPYTQTSLWQSYRVVIRYLNSVGLRQTPSSARWWRSVAPCDRFTPRVAGGLDWDRPRCAAVAEPTASLGRFGRTSSRRDERHRSARPPRVTLPPRFSMTSVQSPLSSRRHPRTQISATNRTLHDEVIWIGSLEPVPPREELYRLGDADDSRPNRVDNIRF